MIFLELVPRDLDILLEEATWATSTYPKIAGINIPDVPRLSTRSHDAAALLLENGIDAVPHIRTIDRECEATVAIVEHLVKLGMSKVLLITGDPPSSPMQNTYDVSPIMVTEKLRQRFPDLDVYCAMDPYRKNIQKEVIYCKQKRAVGVKGFFTQPFFDANLAAYYLDILRESSLFLGISPVITETSKHYWENRNRVVFPSHFELSLEYNVTLSKGIIDQVNALDQHVYLMPIKAPLKDYLQLLFA